MPPLDRRIDSNDCIDFLGCYVPLEPGFGREVVFICPERILDASIRLQRDTVAPPAKCNLERIYSSLILMVIFHELCHAEMAEAFQVKSTGDELNEACVAGAVQKVGPSLTSPRSAYQFDCPYFIEESIATAFGLTFFSKENESWLWGFVENQPYGYKHGLNWRLSGKGLYLTMASWCDAKKKLVEEYVFFDKRGDDHFGKVISNLKAGTPQGKVDFLDVSAKYHEAQRARWAKHYKTIGSLEGIHTFKVLDKKFSGVFDLSGDPQIVSNILGIALMDNISGVWHSDPRIREIMNRRIEGESQIERMLLIQEELIYSGLEDFAQL